MMSERRVPNHFGKAQAMSAPTTTPDELEELLLELHESFLAREYAAGWRDAIVVTLETRFGPVPAERITALTRIPEAARLQPLLRLAVTCPTLDAFVAALAAE